MKVHTLSETIQEITGATGFVLSKYPEGRAITTFEWGDSENGVFTRQFEPSLSVTEGSTVRFNRRRSGWTKWLYAALDVVTRRLKFTDCSKRVRIIGRVFEGRDVRFSSGAPKGKKEQNKQTKENKQKDNARDSPIKPETLVQHSCCLEQLETENIVSVSTDQPSKGITFQNERY